MLLCFQYCEIQTSGFANTLVSTHAHIHVFLSQSLMMYNSDSDSSRKAQVSHMTFCIEMYTNMKKAAGIQISIIDESECRVLTSNNWLFFTCRNMKRDNLSFYERPLLPPLQSICFLKLINRTTRDTSLDN